MLEIILVLSNLGFAISILVYFYLREIRHREDARQDIGELHKFYKEGLESCKVIYQSNDYLVKETFASYLKHIQSLEKLAIPKQPLPVTKEMVDDILSGSIPNDIEKTEEELGEEGFTGIFNNIPFTDQTKVVVEGRPNEIEEEIEG